MDSSDAAQVENTCLSIFDIAPVRYTFENSGCSSFASIADDENTVRLDISDQDEATEEIELPFPFPFNGAVTSLLEISTNGQIAFDDELSDGFDDSEDNDDCCAADLVLPAEGSDYPVLQVLKEDLDPSAGESAEVFVNINSDRVIVEFDVTPFYDEPRTNVSAQAVFFPTGVIELRYGSLNIGDDFVRNFTVGIKDPFADIGLSFHSSPDLFGIAPYQAGGLVAAEDISEVENTCLRTFLPCDTTSIVVSSDDSRRCPNPVSTLACTGENDLVLVVNADSSNPVFTCVGLSNVPAVQENNDNCAGERQRVTITKVTHHGDIPLAEIGLNEFNGLNDLEGQSFKVCAWQVDASDNAVEKQVQVVQFYNEVTNAAFTVQYIAPDSSNADAESPCAQVATVCSFATTNAVSILLSYVGGREPLFEATRGITLELSTSDEEDVAQILAEDNEPLLGVVKRKRAQHPKRKRAQHPKFYIGDSSSEKSSSTSSSSSSSSANARPIVVRITNNNVDEPNRIAVAGVSVAIKLVGEGAAQLQKVESGVGTLIFFPVFWIFLLKLINICCVRYSRQR